MKEVYYVNLRLKNACLAGAVAPALAIGQPKGQLFLGKEASDAKKTMPRQKWAPLKSV
jgi:hypothetical protein